MIRRSLTWGALTVLLAAPALGAPERQASYRDWSVYRDASSGSDVCFAVTRPVDAAPKALAHGDVFMMVSSWENGTQAQPSFHAGYALEPMRAPEFKVGSREFETYADANEAFVEDRGDERALVASMRRGSTLRVEARSADGDFTAYEFSLMGVSAAIDRINALC